MSDVLILDLCLIVPTAQVEKSLHSIKQSHFPCLSVPMYAYCLFKTTQRILMQFFLIDRVIQEEGLYV